MTPALNVSTLDAYCWAIVLVEGRSCCGRSGFGVLGVWISAGLPCMYIHIPTYSMVQSPSWEANWFAASQEIPRISRNLKVHYRTHKRPPTVSILGQPNPVHIPTSHLLQIHPNIFHPSTPRSPQWSLSFRFPHQDPIQPPSPHPHAPHAQPISFFSMCIVHISVLQHASYLSFRFEYWNITFCITMYSIYILILCL